MGPTISDRTNAAAASSSGLGSSRRPVPVEDQRKADLIHRVKYNNALPDIPFDLKFLSYPFDTSRFVEYKPTSLEKSYKYDLLTESDLGVKIDLINPESYVSTSDSGYLDPADEKLLEEDASGQQEGRRSLQHSKYVPWLRKTEYISSEFNRYGASERASDRPETKVGVNVKKKLNADIVYKDRESQIDAINRSFEAVKKPSNEHYSKPGVYAIEEFAIYPDFELWKYPCAQVIFDSDPQPRNLPPATITQALIRGMQDDSGEQFVAYFLPTEETLAKREHDEQIDQDYAEDEAYEYRLSREYNWNVKNKASKGYEENYYLVFRGDAVYYNELETRVRLNRRRHEGGERVLKSRLQVKHRPLTASEIYQYDVRRATLFPDEMPAPPEHEGDEEKMDLELGTKNADENAPDSAKETTAKDAEDAGEAKLSKENDDEEMDEHSEHSEHSEHESGKDENESENEEDEKMHESDASADTSDDSSD